MTTKKRSLLKNSPNKKLRKNQLKNNKGTMMKESASPS
jgi:hypothetical protein